MNINGVNGNADGSVETDPLVEQEEAEMPRPQPPEQPDPVTAETRTENEAPQDPPLKPVEAVEKPRLERNKLVLLGGGLLLVAIMFFMVATGAKRSPTKMAGPPASQSTPAGTSKPKGSLSPLMETVRKPDAGDADGKLSPKDIDRMRSDSNLNRPPPSNRAPIPPTIKTAANGSLGNVPSFADTQQKWEEPRPYNAPSESGSVQAQQQQSALKETSLVFVRTQMQPSAGPRESTGIDDAPLLEVAPGTRILAKLKYEISSLDTSPIVAEVEYTYALGDQIVVPAGAMVFGKIQQADRSGYVTVKFDEIEIKGRREKIEAIGKNLELGPIKGKITGTNAGKNLFVKSISGIGSTLASVLGNNNSSAFSEDDLIRERVAQNIGNAGDSEIIALNANSRWVVSVPKKPAPPMTGGLFDFMAPAPTRVPAPPPRVVAETTAPTELAAVSDDEDEDILAEIAEAGQGDESDESDEDDVAA